jgi:glycosyltransferase involved in cell wall biosynthesis
MASREGLRTADVGAPQRSRPKFVSVVLPVLDEAAVLPEQLEALAQQTFDGPWELLVCDNGSVDGTREVATAWERRLPQLRLVDASSRKGLNFARNQGVEAAKGDYIVFCDGDDVAAPEWLAAIVDAAPRADLVAGALETEQLNDIEEPVNRRPEQLPLKHGFMVGVPGGNCGIWASVARDVGWDERYRFGGSDIEFSWRAQLQGYQVAYAPNAMIHVRHRRRLRDMARQWYQYGKSGGQLYRSFRSRGMPRSSTLQAARGWAWLMVHVVDLFRTRTRGPWVRRAAYRAGRVAGSVTARVLFL